MRGIGKEGRGWGRGIVQLWQREVGDLFPRTFERRVGGSEDLILWLGIHTKLDKHRGCVNTVSFNADGHILISGSDDRMVILWDWERGLVRLSFHTGHTNNVFQAKIMPYTDDKSIITCAADGEVRYTQILDGGRVETTMLARHEGRAHKMAVEPGSPHIFYSCGEDGLVQHVSIFLVWSSLFCSMSCVLTKSCPTVQFDLRTQSATPLFICKSFLDKSSYMPIVHLNTIAIDPRNSNIFAIAGSDEYARLYDIRKYKWDGSTSEHFLVDCFCPPHLIGDDQVGITGLAFSDHSELVASYNDELIYLFSKDQGLGPDPVLPSLKSAKVGNGSGAHTASSSDMDTDDEPVPQAYVGHQNSSTIKGVNFFGPTCEYVVSGSDCGRIFIWRKKDGVLLRAMEGDKHVVNCIEPHPYATMMASSGIENDIKLWTPNAMEPASPVNMDEKVITPDRIACVTLDDYDYEYDVDDDDDADFDDTDSDSDDCFDSCCGDNNDDDDNDDDDDDDDVDNDDNVICDTGEV